MSAFILIRSVYASNKNWHWPLPHGASKCIRKLHATNILCVKKTLFNFILWCIFCLVFVHFWLFFFIDYRKLAILICCFFSIDINRNTTKSRILQKCRCETTIYLCIIDTSSKICVIFLWIFDIFQWIYKKNALQIVIDYNHRKIFRNIHVLFGQTFALLSHFDLIHTVNHRITG